MSNSEYTVVESLEEGQVRELHLLYQGEWWTRGRSPEDVRRMLGGSDYVFGLCANPGGQLAAFARVLTDGVFKALLFDVIVAPGFRDQGLGRRLMDCIIGHPTLGHVRHLELYCLPEMVPFYEKWGFSTDVSGVTFMRRRAG
jgi:GNAT superfamily N-acetyltransferase